jgi:hypothetical protein
MRDCFSKGFDVAYQKEIGDKKGKHGTYFSVFLYFQKLVDQNLSIRWSKLAYNLHNLLLA